MPVDRDLTGDDLARAIPDDSAHLDDLRRRLATAAAAEGVLDVAYRTVDTPVGTVLLAATEVGLVRLAFELEDLDAVLDDLSRRISPRVLRAPERLDAVTAELDEYFAGARRRFDISIDWRLTSGFRATVLHHLTDIGYGHTATYAEIARISENPKAVRAVGSACATNPLPIVVPCHRVLRSDGALGGYLGGIAAKRSLLDLEAGAGDPASDGERPPTPASGGGSVSDLDARPPPDRPRRDEWS